jgi:hypothetical protein
VLFCTFKSVVVSSLGFNPFVFFFPHVSLLGGFFLYLFIR